MAFTITDDYKKQFEGAVDALLAKEAFIECREFRMSVVNDLITEYTHFIGESPDTKQLERLTDYILHEEINDPHPDKASREEYPIFSDRQLERRRSGEVSFKKARDVGTDGRFYRKPRRRFYDKDTHKRNKTRKKRYTKDTKASEVRVYSLENSD
ncbi:hypothetical protein [Mechercharimyces sp. CAU 1602]|uniref:hypothetical protein n=1 Tax=Mechercharimyces sp. CAU 1602 TaxID=2973933 RepID=UPI002162C808|nr:hypothetical protein [Mechercharimyces sp. CAU 1602]MCS1350374.1 hypothetical protein [Mechercharimyces sp. CAU 1602]